MSTHLRLLGFVALLVAKNVLGDPIRVCPDNPHYYFYHGKPIVLITSAEHYGAVINKDFDYVAYLDALQAHELNYTRFYPGAMFEPVGKFMAGNTLGPKPGSLVVPWARSDAPGYRLGGNRFDLDRWDSTYFARFKDFLAQAARRGIIVEVCFFNSQYDDTWPLSPLQANNNIQNVGRGDWRAAQTLKDADLVARQDAYVRKLTQEANDFDNVILEICDEPGHIGTGFALSGPWVAHLGDVVGETEKGLPKKHLLAQEVDGPLGGPVDFAPDPRFTVIVGQYIWGEDQGEMGGMKGLDYKYGDNKPVELNETGYFPLWYKGDKVADSRVEAWEFVVGGGAGFNHLNGLFTVENPAGKTAENERVLRALQNLQHFIDSFDYVRMAPDKGFLVSGVPAPQYHRALSEPGKQYALYAHHSAGKVGGSYTVVPGEYQEEWVVKLLPGHYRAEWVNPETGSVIRSENVDHEGGNRTLKTPLYTIDLALRIERISEAALVTPADYPGCVRVFDGHSFDGWTADPSTWSMVDGAMRGVGGTSRLAYTKADYGSFRLIFTSRMNPVNGDHLGVLFWGDRPTDATKPKIDNSGWLQFMPPFGGMWDYHPPKHQNLPHETVAQASKDSTKWCVTELLCNLEKGTVRAAVDGIEIVRYTHPSPGERQDPEKRILPGPIGMFRHGGGASEYKDIYVEANPPEDRLVTVQGR